MCNKVVQFYGLDADYLKRKKEPPPGMTPAAALCLTPLAGQCRPKPRPGRKPEYSYLVEAMQARLASLVFSQSCDNHATAESAGTTFSSADSLARSSGETVDSGGHPVLLIWSVQHPARASTATTRILRIVKSPAWDRRERQ